MSGTHCAGDGAVDISGSRRMQSSSYWPPMDPPLPPPRERGDGLLSGVRKSSH